VLAVRAPAALATEERVLRALRYEVALVEPDPARAARRLIAIAREDPDFLPAWVSAGDSYLRAGRRFRARRAWERGARRRPAVVLLERLERLHASDGQPRRTERLYTALRQLHPNVPAVPLLHARALLEAGLHAPAAAVLEGLPETLGATPAAQRLWGELHRRQGNHEDAAHAFSLALGPGLGLSAPYRCTGCGTAVSEWEPHCHQCRQWDTLRADVEQLAAPA
jgi:lipopolysaccharide biosynthesis regulator YciM